MIYRALLIPVIVFFVGCGSSAKPNIVEQNFDFAAKQIPYAVAASDKIAAEQLATEADGESKKLTSPRTIGKDGHLEMVPARDWTSGFFPGELWYMYEYTKDEAWKALAQRFTAPLEGEKLNGKTHDMGFKVYCSFGNGYRLTHDSTYREIILEAARTLSTRYNPTVGAIRSWDHGTNKWEYPVIIDNMLNLELLFWAFRESGDSMFYNVAVDHARTTIKNHFRPDYSTYHVVGYNTMTGEVISKNTHQGYSDDSAWARGQAWGVYGYTMCYRETGLVEFLEQAGHIANYIFSHPNLPADLIPYWDYDAPEIPNAPRDVSAATVTASALYELSTYDSEKGGQYKAWADAILENLSKNYTAEIGTHEGFLLLHSTGSFPHNSEIDVPIVYADYYYLEALLRKQKLEQGQAAL